MTSTSPDQTKTLVLKAFDHSTSTTMTPADRFRSKKPIQHSRAYFAGRHVL